MNNKSHDSNNDLSIERMETIKSTLNEKRFTGLKLGDQSKKQIGQSKREQFRLKCKNSLVISKPINIFMGSPDKKFEMNGNGASALSCKSFSVKSSPTTNDDKVNIDAEQDLEETQQIISPLNDQLEDFEISTPKLEMEFKQKSEQTFANVCKRNQIFFYKNILNDQKAQRKFSAPVIPQTTSQRAFEDSYIQEEIIGEGCSSVVKKCKSTLSENERQEFAVKIMRVPDVEYFAIAMKEFKLLHEELDHPNVVKAYDMYYNQLQEKIFMVMEYVGEGSNLDEFIQFTKEQEKSLNQEILQEDQIFKIMLEILKGISYLHSKFICHRDIKPSNIYCSKDLSLIKILDFNVALSYKSSSMMFGCTGQIEFQAPEMIQNIPYDNSVDIWSIGIVLYQLLTRGKLPKLNHQESISVEEAQRQIDSIIEELQCSKKVKNFLKLFLQVNPQLRSSANELLQYIQIQQSA